MAMMMKTRPLPSPSESARHPAAPMTPCIQALKHSANPPAMPIVRIAPALAASTSGL